MLYVRFGCTASAILVLHLVVNFQFPLRICAHCNDVTPRLMPTASNNLPSELLDPVVRDSAEDVLQFSQASEDCLIDGVGLGAPLSWLSLP